MTQQNEHFDRILETEAELAREGEDWKDEYRDEWSEEAIDGAEQMAQEIVNDATLARNLSLERNAEQDFRPTWIEDPMDGSCEKMVAAFNAGNLGGIPASEQERMGDHVAMMMTRNVWNEIQRVERNDHPDAERIHDMLVQRMERAMGDLMRGLVRGEGGTVISGMIDVATYDRQARQFNQTGTVPPELQGVRHQ